VALSEAGLASLVKKDLIPAWQQEHERLDRIDRWYRWCPDEVRIPRSATPELKALLELSKVPWLSLVVTSTAQCMYVDGYRSVLDPLDNPDDRPDPLDPTAPPPDPEPPKAPEGPWRIWMANGMDQRQIALHRAALAYGYSFATVLPGVDFQGQPMPVIRGVSPRKMVALYEDPGEDDWPIYAMRVLSGKPDESDMRVRVYDAEAVYTVVVRSGKPGGQESPITVEQVELHGAGVCPVVRYCNQLDLDGRATGEIEPHIPLAGRINKTSYDRMLVQHYNSWKIRYIAGMAAPDDEEDAVRKKLKLRQDDLLVAEDPDTKFGTLPETALGGFIDAHRADVEALAAVSQTPTHELTGQMANLSAEALAAARASLTQKVAERQKAFGKGHVQALRLAALLDGDLEHAEDITGRVTWQDMEIRSMAQAVDALGKAAQMLHVPDEALWSRIPGVEKTDVEEWRYLRRQEDPLERMANELDRQRLDTTPTPRAPGSDQQPVGQR
jgi:hypothetical protein